MLTSSAAAGPDPAFVSEMLERNRRFFERARELGATRYPISAIPFGVEDWRQHYGEVWPELVKRKQRFDPDNILAPGVRHLRLGACLSIPLPDEGLARSGRLDDDRRYRPRRILVVARPVRLEPARAKARVPWPGV